MTDSITQTTPETHTDVIGDVRQALTRTAAQLSKLEEWLDERVEHGKLVYVGGVMLYDDGTDRWCANREDWLDAVDTLVRSLCADSDTAPGGWYQRLCDETPALWSHLAGGSMARAELRAHAGEEWSTVQGFLGLETVEDYTPTATEHVADYYTTPSDELWAAAQAADDGDEELAGLFLALARADRGLEWGEVSKEQAEEALQAVLDTWKERA